MHYNTINTLLERVNMIKREIRNLSDREDIQNECPEALGMLSSCESYLDQVKELVKVTQHEP